MHGCFAVCGWFARCLDWFDHGTGFGSVVIWQRGFLVGLVWCG